MRYPARFEAAPEGGFVVTFRDIPEAITQSETEAEAAEMAEDALISAMDFYFDDARPVPAPSRPAAGERLVALPASVAAKILLLNEMVNQQVGASELATRLGTSPQSVQRLINLEHATKIDTIEKALQALGKRLEIEVA